MKREEAKKYIEEHDIKFILAQFVDIHGVAKTKSVPADHFDSILDDGAGFAGFALWGYGMGPEGPDLMQKGDLSTFTKIDWMPGYANITCDGYVNNKPYDFDTRVLLKNMMEKFEKVFQSFRMFVISSICARSRRARRSRRRFTTSSTTGARKRPDTSRRGR